MNHLLTSSRTTRRAIQHQLLTAQKSFSTIPTNRAYRKHRRNRVQTNNTNTTKIANTTEANNSQQQQQQPRKPIPFVYEQEGGGLPPPPPTTLPEKRQTSNIALLLDLDNVLIGEIFPNFGRDNRKLQLTIIDTILSACKGRGRVVVKWAYGDALRYKDLRPDFHQRAVDMKDTPPHQRKIVADINGQRQFTLPPPKNSADIKMVVDTMELAYTNDQIDTYVLASGDSDFTPILSKLRELGKHTIVISLPERLSWRLEEYSDETLSLTELFRNRKIEEAEYHRALRAVYAGYELQDLGANINNNLNGGAGSPAGGSKPYVNLKTVRLAMEFLLNDNNSSKITDKQLLSGSIGGYKEGDTATDLDWVLNTKDARKHIEIKRTRKGGQYARPRNFDPFHGMPGPSKSLGALTRSDRMKILEMRLRQNNVLTESLRHEASPVVLHQFTKVWEWKETEGFKGPKRTSKSAAIRVRGSFISKVSQLASQDLKDAALPTVGNRHVRNLVDLGIASGVLIMRDQDTSVAEEQKVAVYGPNDGIKSYADVRECIDTFIMKQVLFHSGTCTIVPDASEWYTLLYGDLDVKKVAASVDADPANAAGGGDNGSSSSSSSSWKEGDTGEVMQAGERVKDHLVSLMDEYDRDYMERLEKRAKQEHADELSGKRYPVEEETDNRGFFSRLFGLKA